MQYVSTTCTAEDAKFEAAIKTEATYYISASLASIVAEFGRDLTDSEKLTRVFENCGRSINFIQGRDCEMRYFRISWASSPEKYDQKQYTFYINTRDVIVSTTVYFTDLLPYGRAAAMLQAVRSISHHGCELACQFGQTMTELVAQHSRVAAPTAPVLFGAPHICKIEFPPRVAHIDQDAPIPRMFIDARWDLR
jgi:hypothetical protein